MGGAGARHFAGSRGRLRSHWLSTPMPPASPVAIELAGVGVIAGAHLVDHLAVPEAAHVVAHPAAALIAVGAAVALGADLDDLGLSAKRAPGGLMQGAALAGMAATVIGTVASLRRTRPLLRDQRVEDLTHAQVAYHSLVRIPIATAFSEELLFRGVILGLALRRLPRLHALALSSVLFGLWHIAPALKDRHLHPATRHRPAAAVVVGTVSATTIAGVGFGLQRLASGSVLTPMVSHAAVNAIAFAVSAAVSRSSAAPNPSADFHPPATGDAATPFGARS